MTQKLTWVLAHEPYDLFLRAAQAFSREVSEKTNGAFEIEVLGLSEYNAKYNEQVVDRYSLLDALEAGDKIQLSQMYTTTLAQLSEDMYVLDLPFIFADHEHAARVLDGEVGRELFDTLAQKSNVQGLAFTYSGGFRIVPATEVVAKLDDLRGLRIRTGSPVAQDTFAAIGAEPVPMTIEDLAGGLAGGVVSAGESTYPRIYGMNQAEVAKGILHTEHSLFLTSLIINKALWNSFDTATQQIFADAALNAARIERQESIEDIALTQARAKEEGIQVVELSADDVARFKTATAPVTAKYAERLSAGLVNRVQSA